MSEFNTLEFLSNESLIVDPARVEGQVSLDRILSRLTDIKVSETHHGPAGDRRYSYDPSFLMRGLKDLYIDFTPVSN